MQRVFSVIWAVLVALFVVLIPIQFYLAGHGAMEGAYSANCADKSNHCSAPLMTTAWDPHVLVGTLMALITILILITALIGRPSPLLVRMSIALFVFMLIQFFLPFLYDSASTRWIAALHGVNALIVTGLAGSMLFRGRAYLPGVGGSDTVSPAAGVSTPT